MTEWVVPLADVRLREEDIARVVNTYRSGWLSMGPETDEFERAFANYTGSRDAIAVANGTAALHLQSIAAGLGPGDEVIVPSLTFVATVNAIAYTGARPVFADIAALDSPWLSANACQAQISSRTAAIIATSYGGHHGEIEQLETLARQRGLLLLEDAAHAAGSRLEGRHLGRFGKAGAFSMFSNKNLAVGEGGMVITDDPEFASRLRLLRSHGMTTLSWERHQGHATSYDVTALGYNYRIDEPRATLARAQLTHLDQENHRRGELDARYRDRLRELGAIRLTMHPTPRLQASHHLFTIVLDETTDRDAFRAQLADRRIQTSLHYPPVHHFSIYRDSQELPLTDAYAGRSVTLPMFAHMTLEQQDAVIDAVEEAILTPKPGA